MENRLRIEEEDSNSKKGDEANKKLELLRVKLLRLALRLGIQNPNNNVIVSQVLQRLVLLPSSSDGDDQQLQLELRGGRDHHPRAAAFGFDREQAIAAEQLADQEEEEEAGCTILVLGKTGVGKSATINSIFGEVKCSTDAFQLGTKKVRDVVGTVGGIKLRIIDTPGLVSTCSWSDQRQNENALHSIKRFIKKTVPDIVIYVDRLDMPIKNDDFGDIPLLQTVNKILGSWLWFKAIVVLTHAESASPRSSSYDDTFVSQRSHVVQKAICEAVGNMRIMNPSVLAENHSRACRAWVPHLLLLSFASMILSEANTTGGGGGGGGGLLGPPPLVNFLLSSLISPIPQLYPTIEHQHHPNSEKEKATDYAYFDNSSDDDGEYDELPPIKFLTKADIAKLTKVEKMGYFDELKYRGKLLLKKNYSLKGKKFIKVPADGRDSDLHITFDSQQPTYLYRFPTNSCVIQNWLNIHRCIVPPSHIVWDHEFSHHMFSIENFFEVKDSSIPVSFLGAFLKDKEIFKGKIEIASTVKHGKGKATFLGFDMRTINKDLFYATLRSQTRLINYRKNKTSFGASVTVQGTDALTAGMKVEDELIVKKRLQLLFFGAAIAGRGGVAYGTSFQATLRDKHHPAGCSPASLELSLVDSHGGLTADLNFQSRIPIGWFTQLIAGVKFNNKGTGKLSLRLHSSEARLHIAALIGLMIPLTRKLLGCPQELRFGQVEPR